MAEVKWAYVSPLPRNQPDGNLGIAALKMDSNPLFAKYAQHIEMLLIQRFAARGADLNARIDSVAHELPEDLNAQLRELALAHHNARVPVKGEQAEDIADFAFRCGQIAERLENFRKTQAAENLIFVGPDGKPAADPEKTDLDTLSLFLAARDRFLRQTADLSLKILVIAAALLILGFLLGLI